MVLLRPLDVVLAIYLVHRPGVRYEQIANDLRLSKSTVHDALVRLNAAGLVWGKGSEPKQVNIPALEELLIHGIRYVFPAARGGRRQRGVPTAHAAGVLREELDADVEPVVWPAREGTVVGASIQPLIPSAPALLECCPDVYELLVLVDALRVGTPRDREVAARLIRQRLGVVA